MPDDSTPRPLALSLFSGAGGLDLGVEEAGYDIIAQCEWDNNCCQTLRVNASRRGRSPLVIEGDVRQLNPLELASQLAIVPGEIDLLVGGPPCQSFSQMGKKGGITDKRGLLLFEMARFAKALQPKAVLVEQVKGVLTSPDLEGRPGGVLAKFEDEFDTMGYRIQHQVLNAANYGIPQKRERVFFVAIRNGEPFQFPLPTHGESKQTNLLNGALRPPVTVGEAINDLPPPVPRGGAIPPTSHYDVTPARDQERISYVPEGQWLSKQEDAPATVRGKLTSKDSTKFRRLAMDGQALTLRCGETFYHPTEDRYLTPREYMRLHGYPDDYTLEGPIRARTGSVRNLDQHRQVANSVPPPLARVVAQRIAEVTHARDLRTVRLPAQ